MYAHWLCVRVAREKAKYRCTHIHTDIEVAVDYVLLMGLTHTCALSETHKRSVTLSGVPCFDSFHLFIYLSMFDGKQERRAPHRPFSNTKK